MLLVSEKNGENAAVEVSAAQGARLPELAAEAATYAVPRAEDRLMMWLLAGFVIVLGGCVLFELVLRGIFRMSV
jgi:hypothetical protein